MINCCSCESNKINKYFRFIANNAVFIILYCEPCYIRKHKNEWFTIGGRSIEISKQKYIKYLTMM